MPQIKLYNSDCMAALEAMDDNQYDLAIVDPPYGLGEIANAKKSAGAKNSNKHEEKGWNNSPPSEKYFSELQRVAKNQIVWGGNYFALPISRGWVFWDKLSTVVNFADGELAWTSFDKNLRKCKFPWLGAIRANMEKGYINIHPTQKPVKLYEFLLNNYAKPGQTILDTHLGSGSIAIACHNLDFDLTGYELDFDYYAAAKARLIQHQKQGKLF